MPVQELFLYLVSRTGNETASAHLAGASTAQLAHWKQAEDFCAELDKAHHQAREWLQYHAWQRAVIGVQFPYFFKGEVAGFRRHYSDRLLVWLLNGTQHDPYNRQDSEQDEHEIRHALMQKLAQFSQRAEHPPEEGADKAAD